MERKVCDDQSEFKVAFFQTLSSQITYQTGKAFILNKKLRTYSKSRNKGPNGYLIVEESVYRFGLGDVVVEGFIVSIRQHPVDDFNQFNNIHCCVI